jgi:hypothetical protein
MHSLYCEWRLLYYVATNEIRMEYIESELAKRQNRGHENDQTAAAHHGDRQPDAHSTPSRSISRAALGKLHEIDLGQEATLQNIARTAAATQRMAGEPSSEPSQLGNRTRKFEDVERDRLVDEVLRESKCKWLIPAKPMSAG